MYIYILPLLTKISMIKIPTMSRVSLDFKHLPGFVCRPIKIKRKFTTKLLSQKIFQSVTLRCLESQMIIQTFCYQYL